MVIDTKKIEKKKKKPSAVAIRHLYIPIRGWVGFFFSRSRRMAICIAPGWVSFLFFFRIDLLVLGVPLRAGGLWKKKKKQHTTIFFISFSKKEKEKRKKKKAVLPCMDKNLSRRETSPCVHSPVDACEYVPLAPKPKEKKKKKRSFERIQLCPPFFPEKNQRTERRIPREKTREREGGGGLFCLSLFCFVCRSSSLCISTNFYSSPLLLPFRLPPRLIFCLVNCPIWTTRLANRPTTCTRQTICDEPERMVTSAKLPGSTY